MVKISVILATYNEEENIKDCLESVKWADEIVVVDGSSTDKTVSLARKYTPKVFVKENPLMFHQNKQLAIEKASGDWLLYLDADERVTPELRREILKAVKGRFNGFWIPRKNIIFGKWMEHTGWWPDYQLRLFKKGKAFLPCESIHEQPKLKGKAGRLKNPLVHYNYRTVSQFVFKLNHLYTENDKNVFLKEGRKIRWADAVRFPVSEFLKRFFKQEGYKDGLHGLVLSLLQSFSALVTFAKIWQVQKFKKPNEKNFLKKTKKEFAKVIKEFNYWFLTSQIKKKNNLFQKFYFRLKRKII